MGNKTSQSQNQNITSLAAEVDDIAMNYILTQNTIDLLRLTDKEYYDKLIVLTSSVIEKKFNGLELGFLHQRVFGKQDVTDIIPASNKMKDKVIFDISKFYIKIIMVYGAIATTIDPQYSYEVNGERKTFYLKEMDEYKNIPRNATPELVNLTNPMNLCRKRLSILKNKLDPLYDEHNVKLNPGEQLCALSSTTSLTDEVGIKELDLLYFDIFDYDTKSWSKRSEKMKQKYNKDLTLFYQIFTGNEELPETITSFNDIELLDLSTIDNCSRDSFKKDMIVSNKNKLVILYQDKIKLIEQTTAVYRNKLVNLLKELFLVEEKDGVRKRVINPKLTLDHILVIESDTRDNILNIYSSCEKYFIQALILFEKIYDEQVKNLNENRIDFIDAQQFEDDENMNFNTPTNEPNTATLTPYNSVEPLNNVQDIDRNELDQPVQTNETGLQPVQNNETGLQPVQTNETGLQPVQPDQSGLQPVQPDQSGLQPVQPDQSGLQPVQPDQSGLQPVQPDQSGLQPLQPEQTGLQPVQPDQSVLQPLQPEQTVLQPLQPEQTGLQPLQPEQPVLQPTPPQEQTDVQSVDQSPPTQQAPVPTQLPTPSETEKKPEPTMWDSLFSATPAPAPPQPAPVPVLTPAPVPTPTPPAPVPTPTPTPTFVSTPTPPAPVPTPTPTPTFVSTPTPPAPAPTPTPTFAPTPTPAKQPLNRPKIQMNQKPNVPSL